MQSDPKSKPTQESALYQLQKQSEEKKLAQQKKISYNKFLFLIYYIGKFIYQEQAQPVNKIIDDFIKDYKLLHKEQPRVMMLDDNNRQILTSPVIETLNSYEQDLKQLYTIYMAENYERQETVSPPPPALEQTPWPFFFVALIFSHHISCSAVQSWSSFPLSHYSSACIALEPAGAELHFQSTGTASLPVR